MNISKGLFDKLWLGAIAVCVVASVFALFFAACAPAAETAEDGGFEVVSAGGGRSGEDGGDAGGAVSGGDLSAEGEDEGTPAPPSVRLAETPDAGRQYLDRFIFLGDSTTYGIGYYYEHGFSDELCPPSQVWTPASGTLTLAYYDTATIVYPETGEELGILDAVTRAKPDILMITLGVNGISFMTEEDFKQVYGELVRGVLAASPETKVILNSIYPVTAAYPYQSDINNTKIRAANEWIEQIAGNEGVRFLYSYEAVADADGNLPEDSTNDIGIHLTGEAFTKVMRYVRTHEYV